MVPRNVGALLPWLRASASASGGEGGERLDSLGRVAVLVKVRRVGVRRTCWRERIAARGRRRRDVLIVVL